VYGTLSKDLIIMKCVLIGTGYWGKLFVDYIIANSHFELVQTADSKTNLMDVWENDDVEAVFIMVPNEYHYELSKKALEFGKHVFCEKPLALTVQECESLKRIAKENDKVIVTDFIYTFGRGIHFIEQLIDDNYIGHLESIHFQTKHLGRFYGDNVYTLLGTHFLSILDMFYNLNTLTHAKIDLLTYFENVETGTIFSFHEGGFTSQIDASLNYPEKTTTITFYGDDGTIIYNPRIKESIKVTQYKREPWLLPHKLKKNITTTFDVDETDNIKYAIMYFAHVIQGKTEGNIDRAIRVTKVLENL
jgi:predicted dehydrogenase